LVPLYKYIKYSELKESDFWEFFGLNELESRETDNGLSVKMIKTGGFQEYIDIEFYVNKSDEIFRAILKLKRLWVGDYKNLNPFAKDIIKSFVYAITPNEYKQNVENLVNILFRIHGSEDKVIYIRKPDTIKIDSRIQDVINVVLGLKDSFIYELNSLRFVFRNQIENDISFLLILFETSK